MLDWPARQLAVRAARLAIDRVRSGFRGSLPEEPNVTTALAWELQRSLRAASGGAHQFDVSVLAASSPRAREEAIFGADLQLTLVTSDEVKWVLMQAKRGDRLGLDRGDFADACRRMHRHGSAYGLVYFTDEFITAPAQTIAQGTIAMPPEGDQIGRFTGAWRTLAFTIGEFIRCSIGSRGYPPILHPRLLVLIVYGRDDGELSQARELANSVIPDGYVQHDDNRWRVNAQPPVDDL
jgi:hypothetical protein